MKSERTINRWLVVFGAILIQLALGALYAWSVFTKLLTDPEGIYAFTATQTAWIFSAGLATFALVMVLAGRWQVRTGPRLMSMLGGLLLGLGWVLGGFSAALSGRSSCLSASSVEPESDWPMLFPLRWV